MSFFEYFPLDHAVQIVYNADNQEISRTEVTSGNVKFGYEQSSWSGWDPVINPTNTQHYETELWFKIPSDAFKYWYIERFFWYLNEIGTSLKSNYTQYYYYTDYNYTPTRYGTEITTGTADFNTGRSGNIDFFCYSHIMPEERSLGYYTNSIKLTETLINLVQREGSEYIRIRLVPVWESIKQRDEHYYYSRTQLHTLNIDGIIFGTTATPVLLNVTPVYPVNVYARNDRDLVVDWDFSNNINRNSAYLYQDSAVVTITDKNGDSIEAEVADDTSQVTFDTTDLDDLAIGECSVHILVTSNYGTTGEATCVFELVGQSDAPEITDISQDSYPTIEWTSTGQISWEMIISNASGVVYKSGMVIGDDQSFTVPILLEDGGYSIELRYVNAYGLLTAWGSAFVNLQPTKPDAPTGIIVSARTDFGVSVNCDEMVTTGKLLAVRRKDENSTPEVLGEYNGSFVDYLVGLNDYYQYTIRNYVEGYADGDWVDGIVKTHGVVIRDADNYSNFVNVWMSEDRTIEFIYDDVRSDVLTQCVGRKYPVAEFGEWVTSERSFSGAVSEADYKKLTKMKLQSSHVILQSKEECFPCCLEFSDRGEYINEGRLVNFRLTRIDGDK